MKKKMKTFKLWEFFFKIKPIFVTENRTKSIFSKIKIFLGKEKKIHWCSKLKEQPILTFTSFVHNSSVNEHMSMELRENICYEIINWISYY